jgi:Small-conductance mechanosensitive channel
VLKILFTVGAFILIAVWIARWVERRLMAMQGLALSMRIGIAKFAQTFLIALSILLGLNATGLDLTTLNVLTGAIGVGLGFGLQAIVANFISGSCCSWIARSSRATSSASPARPARVPKVSVGYRSCADATS